MAMMTFANLPVKDPPRARELCASIGFSLAAGAEELGEPDDQAFMDRRGSRALDGQQWSFIHMDMTAVS